MDVNFKRHADAQRRAPVEEDACAKDDAQQKIGNACGVKLETGWCFAAAQIP